MFGLGGFAVCSSAEGDRLWCNRWCPREGQGLGVDFGGESLVWVWGFGGLVVRAMTVLGMII